jgi:hypothetical protein
VNRIVILALCLTIAMVACPREGMSQTHMELGDVLAGIESGQQIRVGLTSGTIIEGSFATDTDGRCYLTGPDGPKPTSHSDIIALWTRGRAIKTGIKTGAWAVGVPSTALGALLGAALSLEGGPGAVGMGLVFGAIGTLGGGVVGGLAGAAIPNWELVWGDAVVADTNSKSGSPVGAQKGPGVGGLSLGLGSAGAIGSGGTSGLALQGQLSARIGDRWVHGLEFGWSYPGLAAPGSMGGSVPLHGGTSLWQAGWRVEIPAVKPVPGRVVPYAVAGLGVYGWQDAYVGANYGLGIKIEPGYHGLGLQLEARRHDNIQVLTETDPAHWTAIASLVTHW